MIDNIRMYIEDFKPHDIEKDFDAYRAGIDKDGAEIWAFKDKKLTFRYVGNRLIITGSLHKFKHDKNYNLFTYSELVEVLLYLEKKLEVPLSRFNISHIEVGINLPMSSDPMKYIDTLSEYRRNKYYFLRPMSKSTAIKGSVCSMSEYTIIFYDKMHEFFSKNKEIKKADRASYPSNILRFEVRLSSRQLRTFGFGSPITADTLLKRRGKVVCLWTLRNIMRETVFADYSADFKKIPHKYTKALHNKVKEFIFVTSDGYNRYLDYLKEYVGEDESEKAKRNKADLLKEIKPFLLGKYEKELKDKFAEVILEINDYITVPPVKKP